MAVQLRTICHQPSEVIKELMVFASAERRSEQWKRNNAISKEITKWAVDAVSGHAAAGHRYLRGSQQADDFIAGEFGIICEPCEILKVKYDFWSELWSASGREDANSRKGGRADPGRFSDREFAGGRGGRADPGIFSDREFASLEVGQVHPRSIQWSRGGFQLVPCTSTRSPFCS